MTTVGITDDTHFNYLFCMNSYVVKYVVCSELHPQNQRLRPLKRGLFKRSRTYRVPDNCIPHKREEGVYFLTVSKKIGPFKLIICVGSFEHLLALIH